MNHEYFWVLTGTCHIRFNSDSTRTRLNDSWVLVDTRGLELRIRILLHNHTCADPSIENKIPKTRGYESGSPTSALVTCLRCELGSHHRVSAGQATRIKWWDEKMAVVSPSIFADEKFPVREMWTSEYSLEHYMNTKSFCSLSTWFSSALPPSQLSDVSKRNSKASQKPLPV